MTLTATDELWHSSVLAVLPSNDIAASPASSTAASATTSGDGDFMEVIALPAAHQQLLSYDLPSIEDLKGYDHKQVFGEDSDGYASDCTDEDDDGNDESSLCCRRKASSVKRRSRGSWLLGLARLDGRGVPRRQEEPIHVPPMEEECDPLFVPGLVESDECSTSSNSDDDGVPPRCEEECNLMVPGLVESDEGSTSSESYDGGVPSDGSCDEKQPRGKGVSFDPAVRVQPVPHSSTLTSRQRRRMYTATLEVRTGKVRNKKEYRFDGCDWRNATEEWEMRVDMVTGELVHPAHECI